MTLTTTTYAPDEVAVVPHNWPLIPTGVLPGQQFRLIFLTSTNRDASSTDIDDYNTFVQNRAAAGHEAIREYRSGFRVVGSTASVDARDNTVTTGTGVRIYWLNGNKVADDYGDFYDGGPGTTRLRPGTNPGIYVQIRNVLRQGAAITGQRTHALEERRWAQPP